MPGLTSTTLLAIVVSATVSLLVAMLTHRRETLFKKKKVVSSAYQAALALTEMLYRVQRRSMHEDYGEQDSINIRDKFHKIQEETFYYKKLLSLESEQLGKSYDNLIKKIRKETKEDIKHAWQEDGNVRGTPKTIFDMKKIEKEEEAFLREAGKSTQGFFKRVGVWYKTRGSICSKTRK